MLNIVTALKVEAKPIIEKFKLKNKNGIYQNEKINLIITGQGKIKSAINTALLLSKYPYKTINIGIAGSNKFEINQGLFIHKIIDNDTNFEYYPDFFKSPSATLTTVSKIGKYFEVVDMEGSGFFEAAYKFLNVEKIILYKIISDTPNKQLLKIEELIKNHLSILEESFEEEQNPLEEYLKKAEEKLYLTNTLKAKFKEIIYYRYSKNLPLPSLKKMDKKETKEFILNLTKLPLA